MDSVVWPKVKHFIAGSASGVALVLAGHGFDTIKTQGPEKRFTGPIHCLMVTLRQEGFRGLYKGASPPMVATGFINSVMFGLMGMCKQSFQTDPSIPPSITDVMMCGSITGAMISVIVTPIEGIKGRLQVQYAQPPGVKPQFTGPIDCAKKLIQARGVAKGLYAGWFATVLSRGSNWSYFGGYEAARRFLTPPGSEGKLSPLSSVIAGACAGTSYWLSCYPIDVIKNRIQTQPIDKPLKYTSFTQCARTIYYEEGWRAFFKGFTPCLIRSLPANASAFFAFEVVYHMLP